MRPKKTVFPCILNNGVFVAERNWINSIGSIVDVSIKIREACADWVLSDEKLERIMALLLEHLKRGLGKCTHPDSIVKCFVTYVQDLPKGTETGKVLALDLGGTNFRVLLIELVDGNFKMDSKVYVVPQDVMTGTGVQLFDHIANCMADFIKENNLGAQRLPLGFTFSFPLKQEGLSKGILERWTKGFNCSDVIGEDVVRLLNEAIARRGDLQIDVCAVLNDTTGTLMSCAWKNHNCKIGLIVGTGTNACYVEKIENVENFEGDTQGKPHVLINTEWGAFGDDGCLEFVRTEFDKVVDASSINPARQLHEKMISGMYMGELARLTMIKCVKQGILFGGQASEMINTTGTFETKYISTIEAENRGTFIACREVLMEFGLGHATDQDCANVRYICEVVSARAAHMVSAGLACIINKIDEKDITVGIDGSVYRFHPHFHNLMMAKMTKLVKPGIKFNLMLSEDGSGRGAALVAAVGSSQKRA